ncbi:hypothetical protein ADUPG1_012806 [Aduncisulcus paluster]|uniref:CMP/dCMP-type deaminase domain-containing protein n=1 Tax=Aduncisulcus paluster TaxID=2918883 RepID=A0ABQ5K0Q5_9EUKA|nr:hypothetical protein ADUPG1_012806 [Aduncisulcus paluster]
MIKKQYKVHIIALLADKEAGTALELSLPFTTIIHGIEETIEPKIHAKIPTCTILLSDTDIETPDAEIALKWKYNSESHSNVVSLCDIKKAIEVSPLGESRIHVYIAPWSEVPPILVFPEFSIDSDDYFSQISIEEAYIGTLCGHGGPFGAVVYHRKTRELITRAHNRVLIDTDPTAHAEVTAIRMACKKIGTEHLDDYVIAASAHPCPMCFGACRWARLHMIIYSAGIDEAARAGFDDSAFYKEVRDEASMGKLLEKKCHIHSSLVFSATKYKLY